MRPSIPFSVFRALTALCFWLTLSSGSSSAQEPPKPTEKPAAKESEKPASSSAPELPAQIELLETRVRFKANGDSRKEVHARVRINNELGVRQFARLNFDFNRSFESVEIPLVRITHPSGGTADILPGAITDNPNPAVVNAPAYQDVRVKSVRILGLQPSDLLEYRVITTVSHYPLAPDFWFDHTFDRTGVVTREIFELDLPASRQIQMHVGTDTPVALKEESGSGDAQCATYKWEFDSSSPRKSKPTPSVPDAEPDVVITTFLSWSQLSERLQQRLNTSSTAAFWAESLNRIGAGREPIPAAQLYEFVSEKITTIDLPLDFALPFRNPSEILSSGYGRPEEKLELLLVLNLQNSPKYIPYCLYGPSKSPEIQLPRPNLFSGMFLVLRGPGKAVYLDPSLEVAPFGMIRADVRGKKALMLSECQPDNDSLCWTTISNDLPFPSLQRVNVDGTLNADGKLGAKVRYSMRGDNELLLRIGFHQTPKEKWKELAQLMSITDGFRGTVTSVTVSDPYATKEPFTLEYEIEQPKFVDWSKKQLRVPALLPQLGLPEPATKPKSGTATPPLELGTPLEVEMHMTLHLPPGTAAVAPTGTSVQRDYATFFSQYSTQGTTISASRHINFLLEKIPADRAPDYNAFLRAVQNDEAQSFSLEHSAAPPAPPKPPQP